MDIKEIQSLETGTPIHNFRAKVGRTYPINTGKSASGYEWSRMGMVLQDSTGVINCTWWEPTYDVQELRGAEVIISARETKDGKFVDAQVDEYKGEAQVTVRGYNLQIVEQTKSPATGKTGASTPIADRYHSDQLITLAKKFLAEILPSLPDTKDKGRAASSIVNTILIAILDGRLDLTRTGSQEATNEIKEGDEVPF